MKDLIHFPADFRNSIIGYSGLLDDFFNFPQHFEKKYPLDNIIKTGKNSYAIELAVAGFTKDELEVERLPNKIVIRGKKIVKDEKESPNYIKHSIANRSFEKSFLVSKDYEVTDVKLENGILSLSCEKQLEEEEDKHLLEIK